MIDVKSPLKVMEEQKEKSDKLCLALGIELRVIKVPNGGLDLPTLPNMYNPFNFIQLYEIVMHNLSINNDDFFNAYQEGTQSSAVDWLIVGLTEYMNNTDEEYKKSQEVIKEEVSKLGWFTVK